MNIMLTDTIPGISYSILNLKACASVSVYLGGMGAGMKSD